MAIEEFPELSEKDRESIRRMEAFHEFLENAPIDAGGHKILTDDWLNYYHRKDGNDVDQP